MLFWCLPVGGNSAGNLNFPSWVDQYAYGPCSSWQLWRFFRFSLRNILVVAPVTLLSVDDTGGLIPLQNSPGCTGAPQSCCFFSVWNLSADLVLQISAIFHFCAQIAIPLSNSYFPMVIGPLAQYPKSPSMPCFTMFLYTLDRSPPFSSIPCTFIGHLKFPPNFSGASFCVDLGISHQFYQCPIAVEIHASRLCTRGCSGFLLDLLCLNHCPMLLPITLVNSPQKDWSICDVPLISVTRGIVGLVNNVASNIWSAHFQNFGSVAVTGSTSMAKTLLFLSFGSICTSTIENTKNDSQSYIFQLTSVLVISSKRTLNSLGVSLFLISHSTTIYGTTEILGKFTVVKFLLPVVSYMAWRFSSWMKYVCISIGLLKNLISVHAHGLSRGIFDIHGLPSNGRSPMKAITLP